MWCSHNFLVLMPQFPQNIKVGNNKCEILFSNFYFTFFLERHPSQHAITCELQKGEITLIPYFLSVPLVEACNCGIYNLKSTFL